MSLPDLLSPEERANWTRFEDLAERYRDDPGLRARIDAGDVTGAVAELGVAQPPGVEFRIVANSDDVIHVTLPPDPNAALGDEMLTGLSGGGTTASSASSAGSAATVACSCAPSTLSSFGSALCAGTDA